MEKGYNMQGADSLMFKPRFSGQVSFFRLPVQDFFDKVDIALCGVPFDGGSTNKTGARDGPRQIREMAHGHVRTVHPISNSSPFERCRVGDLGDAPVNPLDQQQSLKTIADFFARMAKHGARPLAAGGDHLVSLPILRGLAETHGPMALIHFDSHSDTYDGLIKGSAQLDNGTPFRRAVEERLILPQKTIQIGIRGSRFGVDDLAFSEASGMRVVTIDEYFELGPLATAGLIRQIVGEAKAYLSFDVDALDASFVRGTGAPEIGGFTTREAQVMLRALGGLDIIGADVVEVCPALDPGGGTALVAANLMFEILDLMAQKAKRTPAR
jgi:guanidinopropionase